MASFPFQTLAQAVETYYGELVKHIRLHAGSVEVAEEVVQETWLRAVNTHIELPSNPKAYLYRMASNLLVDQFRQQQTAQKWQAQIVSPQEQEQCEQVARPSPAHSDVLIAKQQLAVLELAIAELPDKCREVFILYRKQGLTMREISQILGISIKTVEKHIAKAMVHCRQCLREAGRQV